MSRILGIDYGEKRIGIAISDEGQRFAFPKTVQPNVWDFFKEALTNFIMEEDISEIVVGLPLGLGGEETEISKKVMKFTKKLKSNFNLPIHLENEVFSTQQVKKNKSAPKEKADASAAALVLQTYLDRKQKK